MKDAVLEDFSVAYSDYIGHDGAMSPPVTFVAAIRSVTYAADADGLIATAMVHSVNDEPCLLTMLFSMPFGEAQSKIRQGRFPLASSTFVTVKRKIDEVIGDSGERYSRFEVDVA